MSRTMLQRPTAGDPRRAAPSYASGPQPGQMRGQGVHEAIQWTSVC